jgi:hypothetical protein
MRMSTLAACLRHQKYWVSRKVLSGIPPVLVVVLSLSQATSQGRQIPMMTGAYQSLAEHPRVFTTRVELAELASRIRESGRYSKERFGQLAAQIDRDLAAPNDWDAAYSGCAIKTYLYAFSYEPQEPEYQAKLRTDLNPARGAPPPAGGAVVASRLALYSALAKAGASDDRSRPRFSQARRHCRHGSGPRHPYLNPSNGNAATLGDGAARRASRPRPCGRFRSLVFHHSGPAAC